MLESKFIMVVSATVLGGLWYILFTFVTAVPKFTKLVKLSAKKIEFSLGILLLIVSFVLGTKMITIVF